MDLKRILLVISVFSVPFLAVSPWQKVGVVPVGIIYVLLMALLLLINGQQLISSLKNLCTKNRFLMPILAYFTLIVLSIVGQGVTGGLQSQHLIRLGYMVFSLGIFVFFAVGIQDQDTFKTVVKTYLLAAAVACIYALYVTIGYLLGFQTGQTLEWTVPRMYGTATEAQVFGNFLLSVLPLLMGLLLYKINLFKSWLNIIFLSLYLLCLVMTFSAGAWFGAVIGIIPLVFCLRKFNGKTILPILLAVGISAMSLLAIDHWIYPNYSTGFDSILIKFVGTPEQEKANLRPIDVQINMISVEERQWFRQAAWNMFKAHPIMGVGYGNYGYVYNEYRPADTPKLDIYVRAHNQYLEILAELGIVGITLMGLVVFQIIKLAWRVLSQDQPKEQQIIFISLLGSLVALSAQGMTLGVFLHNYFWVVLGLTYGAARLSLIDKGI